LHFAWKFIIFVVQKWRYLGKTGYLHYFYAIFRRKIGEITRRIRKIVSNLVKIVSILGKIMSIIRARRSLVIYKTSTLNVNVC
jgi:hypothetical protein